MTKANEELVEYLFGQAHHALAAWCARCFEESPRFAQFVAANRSKVRKKIRVAGDPEALRDLACELAVAYLLTQERSFEITYEPLAAQGSSPDFGVHYKGHTLWYVEVTRARAPRTVEAMLPAARLAALLCGKLRQLPAGAPSLLTLIADGFSFSAADLDSAMRLLRQRAEAKDDAFFAFRGLDGTKAFDKQVAYLSAVLIVHTSSREGPVFWQHGLARYPLPVGVTKIVAHWEIKHMQADAPLEQPAFGTHIAQAAQTPGSWPGGTTNAIYAYPPETNSGPATAQVWVGTALIERAAPYTHFAGRKRVHMPVRGNGIRLHFQDPAETVAIDSFGQYQFAGDRPVQVELIDGPVLAFNLIVQNEVQAEAQVLHISHEQAVAPIERIAMVVRAIYAITGPLAVKVGGQQAIVLQPSDALVLDMDAAQPIMLRPLANPAAVVLATLRFQADPTVAAQ